MTDTTITLRGGQIEQVLVGGDLSQLNPEQRVAYYMQVCDSMGLNPYTKPFEYLNLNGKLTLYARKDATDQLRQIRNISIDKPDIRIESECVIVTVSGHDNAGRTDSDIGVVSKKDMRGDFGNVLMKAVTKAKRRLTLSICGLGMLDETEVETIPNAVPVTVEIPGQPLLTVPAPVVPPIQEQDLYTMSLEEARSVISSSGCTYGEIEDEDPGKIDIMPVGISKGLKKAGLTSEQYDEYMFKLSAIRTIQSARQAALA